MPEKMKVEKAACTPNVKTLDAKIGNKIDPGQTGGVRPIGTVPGIEKPVKVPKIPNNVSGGMTALKNKANVNLKK